MHLRVAIFSVLLWLGCLIGPAQSASHQSGVDDGPTATAPDTSVAANRVALRDLNKAYLISLASVDGAAGLGASQPSVTEFVERLRAELRATVLAQYEASSVVKRTVARAAIRHLEERILAYELAYGRGDGLVTNRWNVLSDAELLGLEAQIQDRLRRHLVQISTLPEASVSVEARGLTHELRAELDSVSIEAQRRTAKTIPLTTLQDAPTARRSAQALARVKAIEITSAEFFAERALTIEVELASNFRTGDPALKEITRSLKSGPNRKAILSSLKNARLNTGFPPGRGPAGPWLPENANNGPRPPDRPGGGSAAVEIVRDGLARELSAITTRDYAALAEASAERQVAQSWLSHTLGRAGGSFDKALESLTKTELETHLRAYTEWKAAVLKAAASQPDQRWRTQLEIQGIDSRLEALKTEISIRGPPNSDERLRGSDKIAAAANSAEREGLVEPFRKRFDKNIERRRLVNLTKAYNSAPDAARADLQIRVEDKTKTVCLTSAPVGI